MRDWKQLLRDADRKFDEGVYAGALDDYRAAATQVPPKDVWHVIDNMGTTVEVERLELVRKLREQHPDSLELQRLYANMRQKTEYSTQRHMVVHLYTELLAKETDQPSIFGARWWRLVEAIKAGMTDYLVEDLQYVWHNSNNRQKCALLYKIAAIAGRDFRTRDERHAEIFAILSQQEYLPSAVRAFFAAKAAAHRALTAAFAALPDDEAARGSALEGASLE